jgi:Tfp pilus assembly protein PilO
VNLTDRDKKIVFLMVPVLVAAAYWFVLLKPKRHEAVKLSDQVAQAQEARDAAVSQANQLTQAKARYASDYAEMVRLGKALPTRVDMPSLLVQLNEAAQGTGIQFGAITVGTRASAAPIATPSVGSTGGTSATVFGAAVQKARAANAAESSSVAQSAAASNAVGTTGASGATGATGATGAASTTGATSTAPTLDEVPLTFKFGGTFFDLADFFHHLKRFVQVANDKINVQGRLITIDSLKFTSTTFPNIEADVTATVYLTPKNDVATPTAGSTGVAGEQSAAISAVSSNPGSSSSSSSTPSGTQ